MKLLVIGSGGREHALAWKLAQAQRVQKVYVAPGNAGTALEPGVENVPIGDIAGLAAFAQENAIHLTVVGPEAPLAAGVVDLFREKGLKRFGPTRAAAQLGVPCADVDAAARRALEADGFGPGYKLPGLPHRTGHGIGLDIHEWPYLVGSDTTPLDVGMCFSNEPMICVPGEFGIRLEDHFYMTATGPKWFTEPSHSIDDPFGLAQ